MILNKFLGNSFSFKLTSVRNGDTLFIEEVDNRVSVILDPGHGGHDVGAEFGSIYEKDIVLNISNKVGDILEKNDINVIYTRNEDVVLGENEKEDLKSRVKISNSSNAEYFISFHINDYIDIYSYEDIYGFEVWTNYNDYNSVSLGTKIEENLENLNYTERRPMLDGSESLYVIRENNIPSILIEFGFMNSYNDRIYFSDEYNQELLAEAVANAIIESINTN
ncbi:MULTISPECIES: N-acetylmuramoyl-L-alanine amidase [unclassified Clostridium]|uniref:N-acetylmuramoyl-L-alanine amidase n=1 Tax=unclassified Clostridium TaxID=2614128 RepID=UPI002A832C81|nr:N-acetylmuramoyl-L-alanine amidase [Clostridium sp.]MDY4253970.1 N-acetylmuramoyl-L-alanine amidase [Clostridium sp.]